MKNGGADVRVLHQQPEPFDCEMDYRGVLTKAAREIASGEPLAGFVVIGIYPAGKVRVGYRYDTSADWAISRTLLPSYIAEIIRRDVVTHGEATDVFNEMFKWQEG